MIYIAGDTHAEFNKRMKKSRFNAAEGDYLIICGDFGGVWSGSAEKHYQSCGFDKWFFGHYHDDKRIGEKMVLLYEKIVRYDTLEEYRDNKERGRGS